MVKYEIQNYWDEFCVTKIILKTRPNYMDYLSNMLEILELNLCKCS